MPVSFLDLAPKPPSARLAIDTDQGPQEIELKGVSLRALTELSERFPKFGQVLENGIGSILDDTKAVTALIAASLGHCNDVRVEEHVADFPASDVMRIAMVVVRLTVPRGEDLPLLPEVGVNGAAVAALDQTSPSSLNS